MTAAIIDQPTAGDALRALEPLVGEWRVTAVGPDGLPWPGEARAFEWDLAHTVTAYRDGGKIDSFFFGWRSRQVNHVVPSCPEGMPGLSAQRPRGAHRSPPTPTARSRQEARVVSLIERKRSPPAAAKS